VIFPKVDNDGRVGRAAYAKGELMTSENRVFHIYPGKLRDKDGNPFYVHEDTVYKYSCPYYGTLSDQPVKDLSMKKAPDEVAILLAQLEAQVDTLKNDKTELQAQVDTLKNDKTELQAQADTLKNDKTELQAQADTLKNDKTELQAQVDTLKNDKTELQAKVDKLKAVEQPKKPNTDPGDSDDEGNAAAE
jgi:prefoldin subunit 5